MLELKIVYLRFGHVRTGFATTQTANDADGASHAALPLTAIVRSCNTWRQSRFDSPPLPLLRVKYGEIWVPVCGPGGRKLIVWLACSSQSLGNAERVSTASTSTDSLPRAHIRTTAPCNPKIHPTDNILAVTLVVTTRQGCDLRFTGCRGCLQ